MISSGSFGDGSGTHATIRAIRAAWLGNMSSDDHSRGFVFWFLELVALGCVLVAVEQRLASEQIRSGFQWLGAGLLIGGVGFNWSQIIRTISSRLTLFLFLSLAAVVGAVVQQSWSGIAALTASGLVLATYATLVVIAYVLRLRNDLDKYVMPRIVTKQQADAIQEHVQGTGSVTIKVNPHDSEATQYAGQLFDAIQKTGWRVELDQPETAPAQPNDGLYSHVEGERSAPNSLDPGGELRALVDALQKSGIPFNGGGGQAAGEYKMFLLVGHRPLSIAGPPLRFKVSLWIMRTIMRPR